MSARQAIRWASVAPVLALIFAYRRLISPFLAPRCRYYPTCSAYAAQALRERGLIAGAWLAVARVVRCNPWSLGGVDPVPTRGWRPAPRPSNHEMPVNHRVTGVKSLACDRPAGDPVSRPGHPPCAGERVRAYTDSGEPLES